MIKSESILSDIKWIPSLFSVEIRKIFSYRADFWVQFVGGVLTQIGIAYFLWKAIFEFNDVQVMKGFTFNSLMLYYVMVPLIDRMVRGAEMGHIALEIFEGTLSRYLIYPVQFFLFKFVKLLAQSFIFSINLIFAVVIFVLIFGKPEGVNFSVLSVLKGFISIFFASYLFFVLSSILEMIAFWVEFIWSLLVMLRMIILLLGGGMIPLEFFPGFFRENIHFLPFPYLVSFPIKTFWGSIDHGQWLWGLLVTLIWSVVFSFCSMIIWKRGLREFTGIGI